MFIFDETNNRGLYQSLRWETTNDKRQTSDLACCWVLLHVGGIRESERTQKEQEKTFKKTRADGMSNVYSLPHRFGKERFRWRCLNILVALDGSGSGLQHWIIIRICNSFSLRCGCCSFLVACNIYGINVNWDFSFRVVRLTDVWIWMSLFDQVRIWTVKRCGERKKNGINIRGSRLNTSKSSGSKWFISFFVDYFSG